jgi:hypothetical protein
MNTVMLNNSTSDTASSATMPEASTSIPQVTGYVPTASGRVEQASTVADMQAVPVTATPAGAQSSSSSAATASQQAQTTAPASTAVQGATYDLGKLGSVTLRASSGFVEVLSLASTWSVERIHGNGRLSLIFTKASERYVLDVTANGTTLKTTLSNQTPPPTTAPKREHDEDDEHHEHHEDHEDHEENEAERDD